MSSSARLIFASVFVVNCILWAQSRYGQPVYVRAPSIENGLVRHLARDLASPSVLGSLDELHRGNDCRPIEFPTSAQCLHVEQSCAHEDTALSVPYLNHYFCTDVPFRPFVFAAFLTWLLFLFSTLGITASDFFTPNLATIAQVLGLDDSVAGVTFLAYGNGSPDLFSTFSAFRVGSGSLAIGELLGAAAFIISCVVGSMCIIRPFKVERGTFLRDVGFFTVAVALMLIIMRDGRIHRWEAGMLIALYALYAAVVILTNVWERRRARWIAREAALRSEFRDDEAFPVPYTDIPPQSDTLRVPPTPSSNSRPQSPSVLTMTHPMRTSWMAPSASNTTSHPCLRSFSIIGALEFRDVVSSLQQHATANSQLNVFEIPSTQYANILERSISRGEPPPDSSGQLSQSGRAEDANGGAHLGDRTMPREPSSASETTHAEHGVDNLSPLGSQTSQLATTSPLFASPLSVLPATESTASAHATPCPFHCRTLSAFKATSSFRCTGRALQLTIRTLFPTLDRLGGQSALGKVACILAAPAMLALTLTLPVVVSPTPCCLLSPEKTVHRQVHRGDSSFAETGRVVELDGDGVEHMMIAAEEEVESGMRAHGYNKWLFAVQCVLGPLFCAKVLFHGLPEELWIMLATGVAGAAIAALVLVFSVDGSHPTGRLARCSMGFIVSIVWIMAIADEVVTVLRAFGLIFGFTEAIIGLTIFAVGNSLADLVANMSVAVFAPIMGFSACFGGPMLNILIGVGMSGAFMVEQTGQPYVLDVSPTLLFSAFGLLAMLCVTLVYVPLNGYYLTRRWGVLLIGAYLVLMGGSIAMELKA